MPKPRIVVEAIVANEDGRILLVRQGKHRTGQWELPGGKVKAGESIFDAICREVEEETGVLVEPLQVTQIFYIEQQDVHDVVIACHVDGHSTLRARLPEIADAIWADRRSLPTPMAKFTADVIAGHSSDVRVIAIDSKDWVGG